MGSRRPPPAVRCELGPLPRPVPERLPSFLCTLRDRAWPGPISWWFSNICASRGARACSRAPPGGSTWTRDALGPHVSAAPPVGAGWQSSCGSAAPALRTQDCGGRGFWGHVSPGRGVESSTWSWRRLGRGLPQPRVRGESVCAFFPAEREPFPIQVGSCWHFHRFNHGLGDAVGNTSGTEVSLRVGRVISKPKPDSMSVTYLWVRSSPSPGTPAGEDQGV